MKEPESQWTAWNRWVSGWIEIAQGLVKVFTLGLVTIAWGMRYVRWVTREKQG